MTRRSAPKHPTSLSPAALAGYGAAGLPVGLAGGSMIVLVPGIYAEQQGLGLAVAGTILTLARVAELMLTPLAGVLSDHTRTGIGARLPWIVIGAILLGVACHGVFSPGTGAGAGYLLLWSLALYAGLALLAVPYGAWGAELSSDYDTRTRIVGTREFCAALAPLVIAGLVFVGMGQPSAQLDAVAWIVIATLVLAVPALLAIPRVPLPARPKRRLGIRKAMALVLANGPVMKLFGATLFVALANGLPASLFLVYVDQVLGARQASGPLLAAYLAAAVVGIPVWILLAGRLSKHRAWIIAIIAAAGAYLCVPFIGDGDIWPFLAICIATGLAFGADVVLPASILADAIDQDHWVSGRPRAGLLFGLWSMTGKLASAVALGLAFPLLAALGVAIGGRDSSAAGLLGLSALFGLGPVMLRAIALAILSDFQLDRKQQADLRGRLTRRAARRAAAKPSP